MASSSLSSSSPLTETNHANQQNDPPEKTIASSPSPLAADFAAIYNLPALARNVEIELHSQIHMFGSQPLTTVFHKAHTVGQMPFDTIPWEDYFLQHPSHPTVSTTATIDASQKRTITSSSTTSASASSFGIPLTPHDRLLSDDQVVSVALAARTVKGTTHPYAHLFNDVLTEGD